MLDADFTRGGLRTGCRDAHREHPACGRKVPVSCNRYAMFELLLDLCDRVIFKTSCQQIQYGISNSRLKAITAVCTSHIGFPSTVDLDTPIIIVVENVLKYPVDGKAFGMIKTQNSTD